MKTEETKNLAHIDVAYVARLARLSLKDNEVADFGRQLQDMLDYFEQIRNVDVTQADPAGHGLQLSNVFREDTPEPDMIETSDVAANAPEWRHSSFSVPRIIE